MVRMHISDSFLYLFSPCALLIYGVVQQVGIIRSDLLPTILWYDISTNSLHTHLELVEC